MVDVIPLVQFGVTAIFAVLAVIILIWFHVLTMNKQAKLSMQLQIHLKVWLIFLSCSLCYLLPLVYFMCFPPSKLKHRYPWILKSISAIEYNTLLSSLRGSVNFSTVNTLGLSTTFVALDRIFVLLFPMKAGTQSQRLLNYTSVVAISGYSGSIAVLAFYYSYFSTETDTTPCLNFSCMIGSRMNNIILHKMFISMVNFFFGSIFIYLLFVFRQKTMIKREKKVCELNEIYFEINFRKTILFAGSFLRSCS